MTAMRASNLFATHLPHRDIPVIAPRTKMVSLLDLEVEWDETPAPRGVSAESWSRARGWSSDD
jgi:hypothetical protein